MKGSTKKKDENVQSPQQNTKSSKNNIGSSSSQQNFEDIDDVYAGLKGKVFLIDRKLFKKKYQIKNLKKKKKNW